MRIFGYNNPKQLFCLHYCDTYKGGKKVGWEHYKTTGRRTTWRCHECGKERYGVSFATHVKELETMSIEEWHERKMWKP